MYKMTPCIDYISNASCVFAYASSDSSDEEDCFPHVLVKNTADLVEYEMRELETPNIAKNVLIDSFCKKVVYYGTRYKKDFERINAGIKYIGEWHEVDDAKWLDLNSSGECFIASASALVEYLDKIGVFAECVCITAGDNCPIYIYCKYFMLVCRCCDVYCTFNNAKYYRVALLNTIPGVVKERHSIEGNFWSLMANDSAFDLTQVQQYLTLDEDNICLTIKKLIKAYLHALAASGMSIHHIQFINTLICFMRRIMSINWLYKIGFFALCDDTYGVLDGKSMCIWHPLIFYNFFSDIAVQHQWITINFDNPLYAEIHMPGIIMQTSNAKLFDDDCLLYSDFKNFSEEFYLCNIIIKDM